MKARFSAGMPLVKMPTDKMLVGLTISWTDTKPHLEDKDACSLPRISHKNPAFNIMVNAWYNMYQCKIFGTLMTWEFECDVIYKVKPRENGENTKIDRLEKPIVIRDKLAVIGLKVNDLFEKVLYESRLANSFYADGDKNKGEYSHCEMRARAIGL
jgi:hypothetical protein